MTSMGPQCNVTKSKKRYYVRGNVVSFEEDAFHEFKGHRNFSFEELHPGTVVDNVRNKRTRAPVSRTINAFLNTGNGGTVYLGITDHGKSTGLNLTQYQKDHIVVTMDDLMARYNPDVEKHRYKVKFVSVVDKNSTDDEIDNTLQYDARKDVDPERRQKPHILRTYNYCWCDKDAVARHNSGVIAPAYIVEIQIKPWNREDVRNKYAVGHMRAPPMHEDETGKVYFRRQGGIVQYSKQQLHSLSRQMVTDYYQPQLDSLKEELMRLRALAANKD